MKAVKKPPQHEFAYRDPKELRSSPHNTRQHPPSQIDEIARQIQANGFNKPVIIDERDEILAGHGAQKAALQLAMTEIPTVKVFGLTAAQKRAYRIADNKLGEKSSWDLKILTSEFADLTAMGFDTSLTGFDQAEIGALLNPKAPKKPDPGVEVDEERITSKVGDLWLLGPHRLMCGDNSNGPLLKKLMGGRVAQCVFTDPPYGVSYQGRGEGAKAFDVLKNDQKRREALRKMLVGAFANGLKHTREDAGWYIWHASSSRKVFEQALEDVGLMELAYLIWEKPMAVMGWSDYRWAHEPCFYAARQGKEPKFYGDRTNTTAWRVDALQLDDDTVATAIGNGLVITTPDGAEVFLTTTPPKGKKVRHLMLEPGKGAMLQTNSGADDLWQVRRDNYGKDLIHPTMKPVELAKRAIENSTSEGDIILDLFGGGGSTLIACDERGRQGYLMELDPKYVDATVRRWQKITNLQATHAESGKTFLETGEARGKL